MSKGFLFSIDALLAVSAIIAVSIFFFFFTPKSDSELIQIQMLRITASDNAIVGFYTNNYSSSFSNTSDSNDFLNSKKIAYCSRIYSYALNTDPNQIGIKINDFCEGR